MFVTYNGTTPVVTLSGGTPSAPRIRPTLIPAGSYTVEISVSSLFSPTSTSWGRASFRASSTTVSSTEVYTITFAASSTYSFEDVNNPAATLGYFSTTATFGQSSPTSAPVTSKNKQANSDVVGSAVAGAKKPTTLEATVSAHGAVSLEAGAKRVSKLGAKRYDVVVEDKSRSAGFTLQKRGQRAIVITGTGFTGKAVAHAHPRHRHLVLLQLDRAWSTRSQGELHHPLEGKKREGRSPPFSSTRKPMLMQQRRASSSER